MKRIICLSGKQYSGKDTVAKLLLEAFSDFKRIGIGDAIKIEFGKKTGLTYEEIDSNKGLYRTGLIELGNKGRAQDPDYWLKKIIEMKENIIVPDVRLLHEAEVFKSFGAYLIRVEADYIVRSARGKITNQNDITECELDNYDGFDYKISNENGLDELRKSIKPLIFEIKKFYGF